MVTDDDSKKLAMCQPPIGLIVCDEGHRLKSKDNKTTKMFDALSTSRRISTSCNTFTADPNSSQWHSCPE